MTYHDPPTTWITVGDSSRTTAFGGPLDGQSFKRETSVIYDLESGDGRSFYGLEFYGLETFGWRVSAGVVCIGQAWVRPLDSDTRNRILGGGTLVLVLCGMFGGPRVSV